MARSNYDLDSVVRVASVDEDAEWQRVNSYIADVLKDCYVLYAKLARLRGDFAGSELTKLSDISEKARDMGAALSVFSKAFTDGEYSMSRKEQFGGGGQPGAGDSEDIEPMAEDFDFSEEEAPEGQGEESDQGKKGKDEEEEPSPEDFESKDSDEEE